MQLRYLLTASSIQAVGGLADAGSSILNYVDPLIGTVNGGGIYHILLLCLSLALTCG